MVFMVIVEKMNGSMVLMKRLYIMCGLVRLMFVSLMVVLNVVKSVRVVSVVELIVKFLLMVVVVLLIVLSLFV